MENVPEEVFRYFFEQMVPFNRFLGLKITRWQRGEAEMRLPFREEIIGDFRRNAVHGGVLAALIDSVGGAAVSSLLTPEDRVSTVDMRIDYLRPGGPRELIGVARVLRMGGRLATVRMEVFHEEGEGEPVAAGTAVYAVRRGHTSS